MMPLDWALVEQMRDTALGHPHNPNHGLAPKECLFEEVEFNGEVLDIFLTYEYYTPEIETQAWHLSVCRNDQTQASDETVMKVVLSILGEGSIMEITSSMPREMQWQRQFLRVEHRKYDPIKREWLE